MALRALPIHDHRITPSGARGFLEHGYLRMIAQRFGFMSGHKKVRIANPKVNEARLEPVMAEVAIGKTSASNRQHRLIARSIVVTQADFDIVRVVNPYAQMHLWKAGKVELDYCRHDVPLLGG